MFLFVHLSPSVRNFMRLPASTCSSPPLLLVKVWLLLDGPFTADLYQYLRVFFQTGAAYCKLRLVYCVIIFQILFLPVLNDSFDIRQYIVYFLENSAVLWGQTLLHQPRGPSHRKVPVTASLQDDSHILDSFHRASSSLPRILLG